MALQSTISQVLINKFSDTVFELAAQSQARLRGIVDIEQVTANQMMFPRIGNIEASPLNTRFPEIQPSDIAWDNRSLSAQRVGVAMFVDEWDEERMLANPKSELAKRAAQALERYFDRVVIAAALATVYTGQQGTTPVTAAADGVIQVNATAGFTYDTLLQIDQNFQSVEVGTESAVRKYLLISEEEHAQLMKEGTLISGDFSMQYVVDKGGMTRALDFEIVKFGSGVPVPMLPVSNGQRTCLAIAAGGIKVGITENWKIDVQERNDRWDTTQILASGKIGATRMEGVRIQSILTTV